MKQVIVNVPLSKVDIAGTQARVAVNEDTVREYVECLDALPPVELYTVDEEVYWVGDGYHRVLAFLAGEREEIQAHVREGEKRDALLHAVGANATHGLQRTRADKRNAVMICLEDDEWSTKSDRWIAEACKVTHPFVSSVRAEVTAKVTAMAAPGGNVTTCQPATRVGKDGKSYPVPSTTKAPPAGDSLGSKPLHAANPMGYGSFFPEPIVVSHKVLCDACLRKGEYKGCPRCAMLRENPAKARELQAARAALTAAQAQPEAQVEPSATAEQELPDESELPDEVCDNATLAEVRTSPESIVNGLGPQPVRETTLELLDGEPARNGHEEPVCPACGRPL